MNFSDLHDKMGQVKLGLLNKEDFLDWCREHISVYHYLPIGKKYSAINSFSEDFKEEMNEFMNREEQSNFDFLYLMYDINVMFMLLFKYVDIFVYSKDRTLDNYDLVIESGFYDYVMHKCHRDFSELKEKCDLISGIKDINILYTLSDIISSNIKAEDIKEITDAINAMDKDKFIMLKEAEMFNNPIVAGAVNSIKKSKKEKEATEEKS